MKQVTDREWMDESFTETDWSGAQLTGCRFIRCRLEGANWEEVKTQRCVFDTCDFRHAKLNGSEHQGSAFLNCRFSFANLYVTRWVDCKMTGSTFEEANLAGVTLSGGDWSYTLLRHHSFKGSNLCEISFKEADLYQCDLRDADLRKADLSYAVLSGARLKGADLRGASLEGIDWRQLELTDVHIDWFQALQFAQAYGMKVE
jgi:fluoroquinolone resistance protein